MERKITGGAVCTIESIMTPFELARMSASPALHICIGIRIGWVIAVMHGAPPLVMFLPQYIPFLSDYATDGR